MARRRPLSGFEERRQSMTLTLAQRQIMKAIDTVAELEKAILAFSEGKRWKRGNALSDCL